MSAEPTPFGKRVESLGPITAHCRTHGDYVGTAVGGRRPHCPACAQEVVADRARDEESLRLFLQQERVQEIGLRGWLRRATFETYHATTSEQREVLATCRRFATEVDPLVRSGLWLLGPPGVGKSHLGAAIALAVVVQREMRARVTTPREIVRELRDTWRRNSDESEEDVIDRLGRVDLLVLDEVGTGFGSDAEIAQLLEVVDRRYQLKRPIVVLSNLTAQGIKAALGERMFDRLMHGAKIRACDWPSFRRPAEDD